MRTLGRAGIPVHAILVAILVMTACATSEEPDLRAGDCFEPGPDAIVRSMGFLEVLDPAGGGDNAVVYVLVQEGFLNPVGALEHDYFINADSDCAGDRLAATRIVADARFSTEPNGYGSFPIDCAASGFPDWGLLSELYPDVPPSATDHVICLGPFPLADGARPSDG